MNTRIAPSPTGDMHLGTARTAYFNWLVARSTGGKFILRIDDTDQARNRQECTDDILRIMDWLSLDYDEIHYQSNRLDLYRNAAEDMISRDLAIRDGTAIRLDTRNIPKECGWKDEIAGQINLSVRDWEHLDSMVLMKSNGFPTYNFCSIIDDLDMEIEYVIRGSDHTSNTSKQIVILNLLRTDKLQPKFAHLGLLFQNKKKLSKRDGIGSMNKLMKRGYDPDGVLNFMLRLGWGPRVDDKSTKMLSRERALELFLNGGKMRNSPANVDEQKLDSFDRKYKGQKKRLIIKR